MGMNLDDGTIRGLEQMDDVASEEFQKIIDQLQPNEVGVFGHAAQIERLQKMVRDSDEEK